MCKVAYEIYCQFVSSTYRNQKFYNIHNEEWKRLGWFVNKYKKSDVLRNLDKKNLYFSTTIVARI